MVGWDTRHNNDQHGRLRHPQHFLAVVLVAVAGNHATVIAVSSPAPALMLLVKSFEGAPAASCYEVSPLMLAHDYRRLLCHLSFRTRQAVPLKTLSIPGAQAITQDHNAAKRGTSTIHRDRRAPRGIAEVHHLASPVIRYT